MSRWSRFWPKFKTSLCDGTTLRQLIKHYKAAGLPPCSFRDEVKRQLNQFFGGPSDVLICDACIDVRRDMFRELARASDLSAADRQSEVDSEVAEVQGSFCGQGFREAGKMIRGAGLVFCNACFEAGIMPRLQGEQG